MSHPTLVEWRVALEYHVACVWIDHPPGFSAPVGVEDGVELERWQAPADGDIFNS